MFRNCCTYERVSTPPVPAFIFDFYWLDLCINPMPHHSTLREFLTMKVFLSFLLIFSPQNTFCAWENGTGSLAYNTSNGDEAEDRMCQNSGFTDNFLFTPLIGFQPATPRWLWKRVWVIPIGYFLKSNVWGQLLEFCLNFSPAWNPQIWRSVQPTRTPIPGQTWCRKSISSLFRYF